MKCYRALILAGCAAGIVTLTGCPKAEVAESHHESPSHHEPYEGDRHKVIWTAKAAERTGLETGEVIEDQGPRSEEKQLAVPYSSVLYTPEGKTWVYTLLEPLTFVRDEIQIDYIKGDLAFLESGPAPGTKVATVGGAEIYGSEFEVGH